MLSFSPECNVNPQTLLRGVEGSDATINHSNDYSLVVVYHFVDLENTDRMSPILMILATDITRCTVYYDFSAS